MRAKYASLLKDPDVKRWYDNLAKGSLVTAYLRLRVLGNFCNKAKTDTKSLTKMSNDELDNLLMDYVTTMEKEGKAGSYVESILKAVKSWLSHNHRKVEAKIKIRSARDTPR